MIEGCLDWQANGLVRPTSVLDATSKYFADQDLMAHWLEEACDAEPRNPYKSATSAELFKSWTDFADRSGEKPGNKRIFAEAMERRGFEKRKGTGGVREYRGVRLKPEQTDQSGA
jgi:putative DNA primase/helicase